MSAFVVSHSLIDVVITAAISDRVHGSPRYRKFNDVRNYVPINREAATEIGRTLLAENERSVMFRYPGETLGSMPGTVGETSASYTFKERRASPVAVLKALNCLDYQSCESDDWEGTEAYRIIGAIRNRVITTLPGYQGGEGWDDFDRKEVA